MKETLPLIEPLELTQAPQNLYPFFLEGEYSFWLDTSQPLPRYGQFSMMGKDPLLIFQSRGRKYEIQEGSASLQREGDPLLALKELISRFHLPTTRIEIPFLGGLVGYFSYDLGRLLEVLPDDTRDDLQLPHIYLGLYDPILLISHSQKKGYLVSTGLSPQGFSRKKAQQNIKKYKEQLQAPRELPPIIPTRKIEKSQLQSTFSQKEYLEAVTRTKEYIAAGDIFQANISQRFQAPLPLKPFDLYRILRCKNPSPFSAHLKYPEFQVASSSPERFIQLRGRQLQTRPIKGTRPRGKTPAQDKALRRELENSIKDQAENVMIVDLERNDFGRIARFGSVQVEELYRIEAFATVFHLVSTVTAELEKGLDGVDVIRHTFPGGSITGAPKIRSMEIIEELEPVKRNIYTGSIGYLDLRGDMDLNIAIRTFLLKDEQAYFQVGGGIVADSIPEMEYQETLDKGQALMETLTHGFKKEDPETCIRSSI